jgi:hypothetical protein
MTAPVFGQAKRAASFTRASGGSIQTKLSGSIIVNKDSSLEREWITLHDPSIPADLEGTVGVTTVYEREAMGRGEYQYKAAVSLIPSEPLAAVEIRFLTFDLWGGHVRNLVMDEVTDMPAGTKRALTGSWRVYSENEVSRHYASIAYVSRLRTKDGRVIETDSAPVVQEAKKFSTKFTAADLEPKPEPQKP